MESGIWTTSFGTNDLLPIPCVYSFIYLFIYLTVCGITPTTALFIFENIINSRLLRRESCPWEKKAKDEEKHRIEL